MDWQRWGSLIGGVVLAIMLLVGCASTAPERSTGQVIDDAAITSSVKARFLADPQITAMGINVDTSRRVVSLTGTVDTSEQRRRAIQIAQGVEGVTRVDAENLFVKR